MAPRNECSRVLREAHAVGQRLEPLRDPRFLPARHAEQLRPVPAAKRARGPARFSMTRWLIKHAARRRWTVLELALAIGWSIYALLLLGGAALAVYTIVKFLQ
jgi:hypothetical protein